MSYLVPIIPDTAPFNAPQRAWINGWLAAYYGQPMSPGEAPVAIAPNAAPPSPATEENVPWHDMTLPLDERMKLAEGRPMPQRLMAAMAQQDCGQCGYLCKTYAEAIVAGAEKALNRCVPGGKATARMVKELLELGASAPAVAQAAVAAAPPASAPAGASGKGTRLALLRGAAPLNR